jgi:hypothetical protein
MRSSLIVALVAAFTTTSAIAGDLFTFGPFYCAVSDSFVSQTTNICDKDESPEQLIGHCDIYTTERNSGSSVQRHYLASISVTRSSQLVFQKRGDVLFDFGAIHCGMGFQTVAPVQVVSYICGSIPFLTGEGIGGGCVACLRVRDEFGCYEIEGSIVLVVDPDPEEVGSQNNKER